MGAVGAESVLLSQVHAWGLYATHNGQNGGEREVRDRSFYRVVILHVSRAIHEPQSNGRGLSYHGDDLCGLSVVWLDYVRDAHGRSGRDTVKDYKGMVRARGATDSDKVHAAFHEEVDET